MTNAEKYLQALYPDRCRVLGRRMKTLCLGHALLLQRLGNPFFGEEVLRPGCGDLALAMAVCGRSYPAALRLVRSRWLKWRLPVVLPELLLLGSIQFYGYLNTNNSSPKIWERNGQPGARRVRTPFLQQVKLTLMFALGKTEKQALCTPIAVAKWDHCAYWELHGAMELIDERDEEIFRQLDAMQPASQPATN